MLHNHIRMPNDKYIFDLKNAANIVQTINRKVEQLSLINKELQGRDLIYEEYLNKIRIKKEELKHKTTLMEMKEKEIYSKFEEMIENNEHLHTKIKELNKMETLSLLHINEDDIISKMILKNICMSKEKINYKMMEAEEKEKSVEIKEKKINDILKSLNEEQKEQYQILEMEYVNRLDIQNFNNALDELSQLKMKDIMSKINESKATNTPQKKLSRKIRSTSDHLLLKHNRANGDNKLNKSATILKKKIREKHASNGLDSLVGIIRKDFKKKKNIVLDGLNISGEIKCRHTKTKSEKLEKKLIHTANLEKSMSICGNRSGMDLSLSDNDISFLQSTKLNKTFYLIQNKRLEQQMNMSLDINYDSVCGPSCCNKLRKNYELEYNAATYKSDKSIERTSTVSIKKRKKLFNGFIESKMDNDDDNDDTKADEELKETKKKLKFNKIKAISKEIQSLDDNIKGVKKNKFSVKKILTSQKKIDDDRIINTKKLNDSRISLADGKNNFKDSKSNISSAKKTYGHVSKINYNDTKSKVSNEPKLNENNIDLKTDTKIKHHYRQKSSINSSGKFSLKESKKNLNDNFNSEGKKEIRFDLKYNNDNINTPNNDKSKIKTKDRKKNLSISIKLDKDSKNVLNKLEDTQKKLENSKNLNESSLNDHILNKCKDSNTSNKKIYFTGKKTLKSTEGRVKNNLSKSTIRIPNKTRKIINESESKIPIKSSKSKDKNNNPKSNHNYFLNVNNKTQKINKKRKTSNDMELQNESNLIEDVKNSEIRLNQIIDKDDKSIDCSNIIENGNVLNNSKMSFKSSTASLH